MLKKACSRLRILAYGAEVSEQIDELLNCQAGFLQDRSKSSWAKCLVIGYGNTGERTVAPKNNVAPTLPLNDKPNSLQCFDKIAARKVSRKFRHSA